jgi:release factor glutamine methyltransferase
MTRQISELLKNAFKKIDRFDAEILLAHVLEKPREFVIAHPEYSVTRIENWKMNRLIRLRGQGIPYAHLTGKKGFYGFDFLVNKHTLVPRPETEVLVEAVLSTFPPLLGEGQGGVEGQRKIILIDIGTGSGCIPISVLKSTNHQSPITTFAIDISKPALKIARKNAALHKVDITFLHGNLLEPIIKSSLFVDNCSLIITANLPYLTQTQFDTEPTIQYEPISALVAEDDGLDLYKKLLEQIKNLISQFPNFSISAFFEIDPSQTTKLLPCIQNNFPHSKTEVIKDGMENDRIIYFIIDKPKSP